MPEPFTINGVEFPGSWYSVFDALVKGLNRVTKDKTTGELCLRLVLQSGGIRDKYLSVSGKIE